MARLGWIALFALAASGSVAACSGDARSLDGGSPPIDALPDAVTPPVDAAPGTEPDGGHDPSPAVLLFSRTTGFRHGAIEPAVAAVRSVGAARGWTVEHTEDAAVLAGELERFDVVVFLLTTGDVLDDAQQVVLERWVRAGGGWVGVHSASDTEYDWPFYARLVGAHFARHPDIQSATIHVADAGHRSTRHLPEPWVREDEWYDFLTDPSETVDVLLTVDESTYTGGGMGAHHPIAWRHANEVGRAFYTALGHTEVSWSERTFVDHVAGGIEWAAGAD